VNVTLELGPEFQQTLASMNALGRNLGAATSRGLGKAVEFGADHVVKYQLMGQVLNPRTRLLSKAVGGWKEGDYQGVIGVREGSAVDHYKYLLGDGPDFQIKPKPGHRLLSIPMGDAMSGAGVLKDEYSGGLRSIDDGFFKLIGGRLFFVKQRGKTERSKLLILFRMVPYVTARPTGALANGTLIAADGMTDIVQTEIAKELNN
jgi:hypothetical protein